MKTTANLGLKKPEGIDTVNIDDLNYNADTLDMEITNIKNGTTKVVAASTSDNATKLATGRTIALTGDTTGISATFDGSANLSFSTTLASVGTAGIYTKVTTDAKGRVTSGTTLSASDIPALDHTKISDFDTQVRLSALNQMAAPTTDVSMNSKKITGLADPVSAQDAATKAYVDTVKTGLDLKDSCKAATTTTNITLSAPQTVDGVSLVAGDRVLVKNQTTASQNGIYVVQAGAWTRATDADNSPNSEVTPGMFTFIEQGTVNGDSGWVLTTDGTITLDATSLSFAQFSGAGQITAGVGLTKNGNTIDIVGTANRITVNADNIDIASTYVGQTSITTLGTIASGTWNGTTIAVANGGTGATTAVAARANLGATGKYAVNIGDGTASTFTLTHGLNSLDVVPTLREISTGDTIVCDMTIVDVNNVRVTFATAPTSGQYRLVVIG